MRMKPCPFCGGRDIRHHAGGIGRRVKCMGCHAEGPPALDNPKGRDGQETEKLRQKAAFKNWNDRPLWKTG